MLRYLVPLVTLVVLAGRSVATFAAAGPVVDIRCCCPDPSTCKCDHGKPGGNTTMKRCVGGEHFVSPELEVSTIPQPTLATAIPQLPRAVVYVLAKLTDDRSLVPEKPPF